MIPFNKPYFTGKEALYIQESLNLGKTSGNGDFTKKCETFLAEKLSAKKCFLTTSCTDALEMCGMLADIKKGDEVIVPSYTFVSTALAFVREGAKIVFADSRPDNPCIDEASLESLITPRTKVIVVVHYAGIACDMDKIMDLARKHNILVVEDAAQGVDSFYKGKPLAGIAHLATISFHETKNIQCGEGGALVINDERFNNRAEILWEKGTNRELFFRGEIDKYGWKDIGSSFLPSEQIAAFLWAQLEEMDNIQQKRKEIWECYYAELKSVVKLTTLPDYATNNAHMFFIICSSLEERNRLIRELKLNNIHPAFHYQSLHKSDYIKEHDLEAYNTNLPNSDRYTDCLLRLPLYGSMTKKEVKTVTSVIKGFYRKS